MCQILYKQFSKNKPCRNGFINVEFYLMYVCRITSVIVETLYLNLLLFDKIFLNKK